MKKPLTPKDRIVAKKQYSHISYEYRGLGDMTLVEVLPFARQL